MKTSLSFICILILLGKNQAQENFLSGYGNVGRLYSVQNYNFLDVETKGCRFFNNENYVPGELKTSDSTIYSKELMYRYDQVARTVQVRHPDGREALLDPRYLIYVKLFIENKEYLFERIQLPSGRSEFLQVIYRSPTLRLFRDSRKKTTRVNTYDQYTSAPTGKYDQVSNDYKYYIGIDNDEILRTIEVSRRAFANMFPQKAVKISQIFGMKEFRYDLNISKLTELMRILDLELRRKNEE
jgi:hypothetical protein